MSIKKMVCFVTNFVKEPLVSFFEQLFEGRQVRRTEAASLAMAE